MLSSLGQFDIVMNFGFESMLTKRLKHALETEQSAMNDLNTFLVDDDVLLMFSF